jgi:putative transposase
LRYGFIRQEKKAYPVTLLCRVMEVSRHSFPVVANLLNRKFDVDKPDTVGQWTLLMSGPLKAGFTYPRCLIFTPAKSFGWAMDKQIKKQLTLDALVMAYWRRRPPAYFITRTGEASMHVMITKKD